MKKSIFTVTASLLGLAVQASAEVQTLNWDTTTTTSTALVDSSGSTVSGGVWSVDTLSLKNVSYSSEYAWSLSGSVHIADTMLFGNKWGTAVIATGTNAYTATNFINNGAFQIYVQGPAQTLNKLVVAYTGENTATDTGIKLGAGDTLQWNLYYAGNGSTEATLSLLVAGADKCAIWSGTLTNVTGTIASLTTGNSSVSQPTAFERGAVTYASGADAVKFVPEPTTATLSLLALAGLVARRRRKK